MGETNKQVRVDNWGIFFLQRLQLFFNRTDYCDLTLQFEGNVQLKVHRLVMNACTEYFSILEQTCEVIDGNTIIMPDDLQADVILPIVNFMYTGMLEFQMSLYDKLYRTADTMNIPILTKLLDAQKKPILPQPKLQPKKSQLPWNLHSKKVVPKVENDLPPTLPGRKLPVWKRKTVPTPAPVVNTTQHYPEPKKVPQDPLALFDNTPKPTRFEWPEDEIHTTFNLMETSFDDISYTSKPLITQDDELRASTSFDDIRYSPNTNKKVKDYNPAIDMEEVKSYVKEQKIRSDLAEYDDEDDPDNYLENVNIDKDSNKRKAIRSVSPMNMKRVRFSVNEKENKEAKINITATGKAQEMDHTKIISEVLRKYPHLVKKNKNIKLKILAKSPTKMDLSKNQGVKTSTAKVRVQVTSPKASPRVSKAAASEVVKNQDEGPWVCTKCSSTKERVEFVLYYLYRKHMTDIHHEKFDSRMCKFCGHQSSKHNMLMYHQYTRHGIKPPPAYNFPKCNRCPYIALTENLLIKHKLNHTKFDLQCMECKVAFNNQASLSSHMQITGHTGKAGRHNYDCQYCTKRYHSGSNLFSHIKLVHRDEARRDGIVSIDEKDEIDDDQLEEEMDEYIIPKEEMSKEKIKILSDIQMSSSSSQATQQSSSTTTARVHEKVSTTAGGMENVPGGIATSLGLVDIVVLDENQQYILHNDQQLVTQQSLANDQPEYIIPEISEQHTYAQGQNINEVMTSEHNVITQSILNNSDIASTDELVMVLTDHDYNDGNSEILSGENSNIVVLYSHPVDGQQNQFITSQGNLMLNSQTGMLEIRNSEPHSMENSQDAQIESIEMIQREINSHNIMTTPHTTAVTVPSSSFEESLTQNTVMLENQFDSNADLMENKQQVEQETTVVTSGEDIDMDRMISINDKHIQQTIEDDVADHVLVLNDCLSNQHEEPMEIDEECSVQDNQNENQTVVLQEAPPSDTPQSQPSDVQEEPSKSMPEIDDTAPSTVSHEEAVCESIETTTLPDQSTDETADQSMNYVENNDNIHAQDENVAVIDAAKEEEGGFEVVETSEMIATSESQTIQYVEEEVQVQTVENVVSAEIEQVPLETVVTTDEVQENPVEDPEKLEEGKVEEEKIAEQVPVVDEPVAPAQETNEMEVQHELETVIKENHQVLTETVSVETQRTEELPQEHAQEPENEEQKAMEAEPSPSPSPSPLPPKEDMEINEEVTGHVEEIVENVEEMPEANEVTTEKNTDENDVQHPEEQVNETLVQTEENALEDVEHVEEPAQAEVHAEVEVHPQVEMQSQVDDSQSQAEVSQMEDSQMEETGNSYMEISLQTESSPQIVNTPSQIDENSAQNESTDEVYKDDKFQEETSQTDDKINFEEQTTEEGVSSIDENSQSQDSQTSQCSSRQEELIREFKKTSSSQATKISILNDWEDTEDSQQSDNVSKKAELTVNKLIHDWDDDDEEGHESDS